MLMCDFPLLRQCVVFARVVCCFFFFKQKTAYEVRISDWSSDVCSSDLVICSGKLTSYPGRSKYQMVVERMELAGLGALMALLEQRKQKLAGEGLFAPERKRPERKRVV